MEAEVVSEMEAAVVSEMGAKAAGCGLDEKLRAEAVGCAKV